MSFSGTVPYSQSVNTNLANMGRVRMITGTLLHHDVRIAERVDRTLQRRPAYLGAAQTATR